MNVVQAIFPFWPFAETVRCSRCGEPVDTREAVAIVDCDRLAGFAHDDCDAA